MTGRTVGHKERDYRNVLWALMTYCKPRVNDMYYVHKIAQAFSDGNKKQFYNKLLDQTMLGNSLVGCDMVEECCVMYKRGRMTVHATHVVADAYQENGSIAVPFYFKNGHWRSPQHYLEKVDGEWVVVSPDGGEVLQLETAGEER